MKEPYFDRHLDISRCGISSVFVATLIHRVTSVIGRGSSFCSARLSELAVAFAAHRLFPVFHFGYTVRNLLRKIKARLRG